MAPQATCVVRAEETAKLAIKSPYINKDRSIRSNAVIVNARAISSRVFTGRVSRPRTHDQR
jgi:hypothetical protein